MPDPTTRSFIDNRRVLIDGASLTPEQAVAIRKLLDSTRHLEVPGQDGDASNQG
jgi:hypothetical protein